MTELLFLNPLNQLCEQMPVDDCNCDLLENINRLKSITTAPQTNAFLFSKCEAKLSPNILVIKARAHGMGAPAGDLVDLHTTFVYEAKELMTHQQSFMGLKIGISRLMTTLCTLVAFNHMLT